MKKIFWIIVIMTCIGGWINAQGLAIGNGTLTFGGKLVSGIFFDADDAPKEDEATKQPINGAFLGKDGRMRMYNDTDSDTGLRADLTATYINENAGFSVRLRSETKYGLDGYPVAGLNTFARFAYGWVNLFNESVKFTGGLIDLTANVWGTLGDLDKDIGGEGLRLELRPFRFANLDETQFGKLNLGAFFRVPSRPNSNTGRDDEGRDVYRTLSAKRVFGETVLGLSYTHPWLYTRLQFEMDSDIDGVDAYEGMGQLIGAVVNEKVWSGAGDEASVMFGAGFTMLPEAFFSIEGIWYGLGNWEARGNADLRQTLWYSFEKLEIPYLDRLRIGVKAQEILWGYNLEKHLGAPFDKLSLSPWIQVKPFIEYRVTPEFKAGFEMGFGGGHLVKGSLLPPSSNTNDTNDKARKFVNEKSNIFIKPQLWYNFGGGLALTAWYKATFITYQDLAEDPAFDGLRHHYDNVIPQASMDNYDLLDKLTQSQIALEFIWSF